jgi:hypothetical protein
MNHWTVSAAICGLTLLFTGPVASPASVGFSVALSPPAPVVETVPPPPTPGGAWTPGYWSWDGVKYVWVPGQYAVPPFPGAVWIGGRWVPHGARWVWLNGHWGRR